MHFLINVCKTIIILHSVLFGLPVYIYVSGRGRPFRSERRGLRCLAGKRRAHHSRSISGYHNRAEWLLAFYSSLSSCFSSAEQWATSWRSRSMATRGLSPTRKAE